MGAHHILMGPTSDLGPVDPQFEAPNGQGLYSAKDLIAAVDHAEASIAENPESYPLHVSLLADVNAVMVQQARSALERSSDLVREALESNPERSSEDVSLIAEGVKEKLIDLPTEHGAVFDAEDAEEAGLPVIKADPSSDQWKLIWMLWAKYFSLYGRVTEGRIASQVFQMAIPGKFFLLQRARAAALAASLRSSGVMRAALALPPFRPPALPRATAAGFFWWTGSATVSSVASSTIEAANLFRSAGFLERFSMIRA